MIRPGFDREKFQKNVNLLFVALNLIEDIFLDIRPDLLFEWRLAANRTIKDVSKFNRLAERVFDEHRLESFDHDKDILRTLIESSYKASDKDIHDKFLIHIDNFFKNN